MGCQFIGIGPAMEPFGASFPRTYLFATFEEIDPSADHSLL